MAEGRTLATDGSVERYVLAVSGEPPLDPSGFLTVDMRARSRFADPRPATGLAGLRSFALLAPGGAGKTTALDSLRGVEPDATHIDLAIWNKGDMHVHLHDAMDKGAPIYLDALEVAALAEPMAFRVLTDCLAAPSAATVPWRLACRPAAWTSGLASALRKADGGFEELKLLPLTRDAAHTLIAAEGIDAASFLDALVRANLGRLAANPMRLLAAAEQWNETGALPHDDLSAMEYELGNLLADVDHSPLGAPEDAKHRTARRLGAISVFCGITRFGTAPGPRSAGRAGLNELPSDPEPGSFGTPDYAAVVSTPLFDPAPGSSVAFRHQTYAEYLAAAYLAERNVNRPQLDALLGIHGHGVLPGPVFGVAAWLAALRPELVDDLMAANALGFTQTGVELPSEAVRALVVTGILDRAARAEIDLDWGLDLSPLAHTALEQQLGQRLDRGLTESMELWWVSRLAADGNCRGIVRKLLLETLADTWVDWARRAAGATVAALGNDDDIAELAALLDLDNDEDPDDELLATAIEALYPRQLTTTELLAVLRPRRNRNLLGAYRVLLGRLGTMIPDGDLPAALDWASSRVVHGEEAFGHLVPELIYKGWRNAHEVDVLHALAAVVAAVAGDDRWRRWERNEVRPWADDTARRRQLAIAVAGHLTVDHGWYDLLDLDLVTSDDADWLLNELPEIAGAARETLAQCVRHIVHNPTADIANLVLALPTTHPAYQATQHWRESIDLASDTATRWRELRAMETRRANQVTTSREERRTQLSAALDAAESDIAQWWRILFWLSVGDNSQAREDLFSHDLTARPGWTLLTDDEQARVLQLGLLYISRHIPEPGRWQGRKSVTMATALPDWCGVYLLTTLTRLDRSVIVDLDTSVWIRWAASIMGAWNFDKDEDADLRCDLVDLAPPSAGDVINAAAMQQLDALQIRERYLTPRNLYEHLAADLAPTIAQRLGEGRYTGELGASLIDLLVRCASHVALDTCHALRAGSDPDLAKLAYRSLATLDPGFIVNDCENAASDRLRDLLPQLDLPSLTDNQLATVGRIVLDHFPYAHDPPVEEWNPGSDPTYNVRRTRSRVLERLADLGRTDALETLTAGRTDEDGKTIRWYLRHARSRAADLAFTRPTPHQLLNLLDRSDARLVRHSKDLQAVIIDQLHQIQHDLKHGSWRDIWNLHHSHDDSPQREDDISDWIKRGLNAQFRQHIVVDREVQVERRTQAGFGTRIDLTATAPTVGHPLRLCRVIIEAKMVNNTELDTAIQDQLIDRYLTPEGQTHGIYLVYWVSPDQRPPSWRASTETDMTALQQRLLNQTTAAADDGLNIQAFILDISKPAP